MSITGFVSGIDGLLIRGCGHIQSEGWGAFIIHETKLLWPAEDGFSHVSVGAK